MLNVRAQINKCDFYFQSDLHQERASNVTLLDMDPGESRTSACEASHYVVIDSNVALEQV